MSELESLKAENESLKALIEEQRRREVDDLKQRLSLSENSAQHYRNEAERNASAAKELVAMYEKRIAELQAKLDTYERTITRRPS